MEHRAFLTGETDNPADTWNNGRRKNMSALGKGMSDEFFLITVEVPFLIRSRNINVAKDA